MHTHTKQHKAAYKYPSRPRLRRHSTRKRIRATFIFDEVVQVDNIRYGTHTQNSLVVVELSLRTDGCNRATVKGEREIVITRRSGTAAAAAAARKKTFYYCCYCYFFQPTRALILVTTMAVYGGTRTSPVRSLGLLY